MKQRKQPGLILLLLFTFSIVCVLVLPANNLLQNSKIIKLCAENHYTEGAPERLPYQHAIVRQMMRSQASAMPLLKPASVRRVMKMVSISGKEPKAETTGALQNLFLTVHNGSTYLIEQVQVEIEFKTKSGKSLGNKIIPVDKLKPSASSLIQVPFCKNGMNVTYKIMNIYMPSQKPVQKLS